MSQLNRSAIRPNSEARASSFTTRVVPLEKARSEREVSTRKITNASGPSAGEGFLVLRDLIIPLSQKKETLLGRDSSRCNVILADPRVSKSHAAIYFSDGQFFLRDLGSVNGTFLNKVRVHNDSETLVDGDQLHVRPYRMMFVGPKHPQVAKKIHPQQDRQTSQHLSGHFSGKLEILRMTDLVQLLNSTRQNGVLTIRDPSKHVAEIAFVDGEIQTARYKQLQGEEAVYGLLDNVNGDFEFVQGSPPSGGQTIQKQTLSMLLEGCRLLEGSGDEQAIG